MFPMCFILKTAVGSRHTARNAKHWAGEHMKSLVCADYSSVMTPHPSATACVGTDSCPLCTGHCMVSAVLGALVWGTASAGEGKRQAPLDVCATWQGEPAEHPTSGLQLESQVSWKESRPLNIYVVTDRVLQFTYNNVKEVLHTRYLLTAHIHLFAFTLHFVSPLRQELGFFFTFGVKTASATILVCAGVSNIKQRNNKNPA